jgi:hypothetical protein
MANEEEVVVLVVVIVSNNGQILILVAIGRAKNGTKAAIFDIAAVSIHTSCIIRIMMVH